MRRCRGVNQRIALPLFQKLFSIGERLSFALVVRRGKIDKRFPQHPAHACGFGFLRDSVFKVIHIGKGRDATTNLFRRRQPRSPADKFFVHILGFGREDVFVEPVVERDVIVQAAEQGHRHMSVAVDEPRQNQLAFGINCRGGRVLGFKFRTGGDGDDLISSHSDGAVLEDLASSVHGDNSSTADKQVNNVVGASLRNHERGKEKQKGENEKGCSTNNHG